MCIFNVTPTASQSKYLLWRYRKYGDLSASLMGKIRDNARQSTLTEYWDARPVRVRYETGARKTPPMRQTTLTEHWTRPVGIQALPSLVIDVVKSHLPHERRVHLDFAMGGYSARVTRSIKWLATRDKRYPQRYEDDDDHTMEAYIEYGRRLRTVWAPITCQLPDGYADYAKALGARWNARTYVWEYQKRQDDFVDRVLAWDMSDYPTEYGYVHAPRYIGRTKEPGAKWSPSRREYYRAFQHRRYQYRYGY